MASDVKWIKIVTDIFDDEKILLIEQLPEGYAIIVCWFKLLCLAGKANRGGLIMLTDRIPYTDEMLAAIWRMPLNTVRMALETFEQFGMIERIENVITIPSWRKHQSLDALEKKREYDRNRMAAKRAEDRILIPADTEKGPETDDSRTTVVRQSYDCSTTVVSLDIDKEEDIDIDNREKAKKPKRQAFVPPTLEEVTAYCNERGNDVDPKKFWEYYEQNDWRDSRGRKVSAWKQRVISWEGREFGNAKAKQKTYEFQKKTAPTEEEYQYMQKLLKEFGG